MSVEKSRAHNLTYNQSIDAEIEILEWILLELEKDAIFH
jgi:hypothetical protein